MDSPVNDGGARALSRLPVQDRPRPRIRGLATAIALEAQELDAGLYTLWTGRQLATAIGDMLEVYGRLVGEERLGREDAAYRVAIQARMLINRGSGTPTEMVRLLRLLAPEPLVLTLTERFPAGVALAVSNGTLAQPAAVHAALQSARPAGVGLRLSYQAFPDAERFVTAGGVGLGFAGPAADYVGPREVVRAQGVTITNVQCITMPPTGAELPIITVTGPVPAGLAGNIRLTVIDDTGNKQIEWYGNGGGNDAYGNSSGTPMLPAPQPLVDENVDGGGPVGLSVTWQEIGAPYALDESFTFDLGFATSSAPTLADAGTVSFTGKVRVEVAAGAPGYTFRYWMGSAAVRTVAMVRGTAVSLLKGDGTASGLTVTWPNVATHYPMASWAWQVLAANPVVGGRFVYLLGG